MYQEKVESRSIRYPAKSQLVRYVLAFGLLMIFAPQSQASLIDAKYKLARKLPSSHEGRTPNEVGNLYKKFLSKSMYSRCRWLPSDSQYLAISSKKCGPIRGTILAFSRFMTEHDADKLSAGVVNDTGRIRFLDFGDNCDLL